MQIKKAMILVQYEEDGKKGMEDAGTNLWDVIIQDIPSL